MIYVVFSQAIPSRPPTEPTQRSEPALPILGPLSAPSVLVPELQSRQGPAPTTEQGPALTTTTTEQGPAPTTEQGPAPTIEQVSAPTTEQGLAPTTEQGPAPTTEHEDDDYDDVDDQGGDQARLDSILFDNNDFDDIQSDDDDDDDDDFDLDIEKIVEDCLPQETSDVKLVRQYVIDFDLTQSQTTGLLKMLSVVFDRPSIPLAPATLLRIPKVDMKLRPVSPGEYLHVGIEKTLTVANYPFLNDCEQIELDVCIDGVPLVKSSRLCMWPILGAIVDRRDVNPFLIGVYVGRGSPKSITDLFQDYVQEMKTLDGLLRISEKKSIRFTVRAYCCDAPARSFLASVRYHTGFHGCTKCCQIGKKVDRTTVFSKTVVGCRTDQSYTDRSDPKFHSELYLTQKNPLEELGTQMITQVPIEPMHLLDLGVMKKLLVLFLDNSQKKFFETKENIAKMEAHFLSIVDYVPSEFKRAPRVLAEVPRYKATEFRQFLLYTGPVVLRNTLKPQAYSSFLKLHVATRLLYRKFDLDFADSLLSSFVQDFGTVFPEKSLTYNIHNLLHIRADVETYGLESISNYKFENYMQIIKNRLRISRNIFRRILNVVYLGSLAKSSLNFGQITYSDNDEKNNHCLLKDDRIVEITEMHGDSVVGRQYLPQGISDFYPDTDPQYKRLKVFVIDPKFLSTRQMRFTISNSVRCKLFRIPLTIDADKFVVFPLIHTV
jgi:hypothetical protein